MNVILNQTIGPHVNRIQKNMIVIVPDQGKEAETDTVRDRGMIIMGALNRVGVSAVDQETTETKECRECIK
jgi:hypothetical protein